MEQKTGKQEQIEKISSSNIGRDKKWKKGQIVHITVQNWTKRMMSLEI